MNIEQDRQDRQDRVFGALDVATKPVQIAVGIVQMLLLLIAVLALTLGYPFYMYFTGQPVTPRQIECAITAALFIISVLSSPTYTVVGSFLFFLAYCTPIGEANLFPVITMFLGLGIVLRMIKSSDDPKPETTDYTIYQYKGVRYCYFDPGFAEAKAYWAEAEKQGTVVEYKPEEWVTPGSPEWMANPPRPEGAPIPDCDSNPEYLPPDEDDDAPLDPKRAKEINDEAIRFVHSLIGDLK